jgi:WD40 repeat protein
LDRIPVRLSQVRVVAVSPNGHYLVLAGVGSAVQIWDAQSRLPITIGEVQIPEVRSVAFDGPQTHVYLGGVATQLIKVQLASGKVVEQWDVDGQVQTMALTRDAQSLVLGLRDGRIQLRDTHGRLLKEALLHQGWVSAVELSLTQDLGVSVGADGRTQFWQPSNLRVLDSHQDHTGRVTALALSADGKYIVTGGEDQTLVVSEGRKPWGRIAQLQGQRGTIRCMAFDPSSQWLAAGGDDASVRLWNVQLLDADPRTIQAKSSSTWGLRLEGARVLGDQ